MPDDERPVPDDDMSYGEERLTFPPLTPAIKHLMIANAVVFVINTLLGGLLSTPGGGGAGGYWFAFSWSGMFDGYGLGVLRLLTYQFTHSFYDVWHFLGNMIVLYVFGTMAEHRLGYRGALKLYVVGGICGALLHLLIAATRGEADVNLVGASGACYAFMLYAAAMAPNAIIIFIIVRLPLWLLAGVLVFVALYTTYVEYVASYSGGVSHGAHLGGALLGYLAFRFRWFTDLGLYGERPGFLVRLRDGLRQRRRRRAATQAAMKEQQLDEILAKVKQHGIGALTPAERRFLEKASEESRKGS